ncbi:MAG TPA: flagellar filament capping protein FliD, partial [Candidatus Acidoferrum sp.]|nr:flagellar filament capping protein FliD [Candidatus Acidoferrum sp.]
MSSSISSSTSGANLLATLLASGSPPSLNSSATSPTGAPNLAITGLASGMNWSTVISELAQAERSPETTWQREISALNRQKSAYTTLNGDFATLQTDIQTLQDASVYTGTSVQSSNSAIATASGGSAATLGNYTFNITQLATAARINGTAGVSQVLSPGGNIGTTTIGTAGFASQVTAGTFSVNGAQVTIAATDSLQQVFNNIASATNNAVTASYNSTTDKITLSSSGGGPVVLGSAADTSNFLQVAQLYNNGTNTVTSTSALGHVQLGVTMSGAGLKTAITDGGGGKGQFTINGVAITYDASNDSVQNVLDKINSSTAGVTASYNSLNDQFTLTNNTTGNVGISLQDVTGNFLQATGLSSGALQSGANLLYTLNGGSQQLVSQSNTISQTSSSIAGLSVTALQTGSVNVAVSSDASSLTTAIQQFVTDYNSLQSTITSDQAVTIGSNGSVTPGILTGDLTANGVASG